MTCFRRRLYYQRKSRFNNDSLRLIVSTLNLEFTRLSHQDCILGRSSLTVSLTALIIIHTPAIPSFYP